MFLPHDLSPTARQQRLCRQQMIHRAEVSRAARATTVVLWTRQLEVVMDGVGWFQCGECAVCN